MNKEMDIPEGSLVVHRNGLTHLVSLCYVVKQKKQDKHYLEVRNFENNKKHEVAWATYKLNWWFADEWEEVEK
jgi:hypothetical protein